MPLSINCWPSVSGGESYVNIEYESTSSFDLQNVQIAIPLPPAGHAPTVNQVGSVCKLQGSIRDKPLEECLCPCRNSLGRL